MTNCPVCGEALKTIPAGKSKKCKHGIDLTSMTCQLGCTEGKPYKSFVACPNKCKTSWNSSPQTQNGGKVNVSDRDPMIIIGDELASINKRLDDLAIYLKSKFN